MGAARAGLGVDDGASRATLGAAVIVDSHALTSGRPSFEAEPNTSWLVLQTPTGTNPAAFTARAAPAMLARFAGLPCGDPSCSRTKAVTRGGSAYGLQS